VTRPSFVASRFLANRSSLLLVALLALIAFALAIGGLTTALGITVGALLVGALFVVPEVAVYLLVFAVPFGSLLPLNVGGGSVTAADALLLVAWVLYLMRGIARRKIELRPPPLLLPFVLFIFAAALSITVASSLTDSIQELTKWIEMLAAYWLVAQFFDAKQVQRLLLVIFCAGLAEAALGAYQYYFRAGPEGFLLFGGANLRAYGTFEQPNPYAGYLGLILPLAFGTGLGILLDIARRGIKAENFFRYVLALVGIGATGAMLAALFFSYSRGAWIASAAALGVTGLLILVRSKRAATLAIILGLIVVIVLGLGEINVVPNIIAERFASVGDYFNFEDVRGIRANDDNFALLERRAHWQAALGMFEDNPILGVGFGNYAVAYPQYALPMWSDPLGHAHNYYLNVLAEAGAIGFVTYLILWGALVWRVGRAVIIAQTWRQAVLAGAFGVLVALSIHNFFDNLFVHAMYIQVGLTLGIVVGLGDGRLEIEG
jgi:O-antigen ligase